MINSNHNHKLIKMRRKKGTLSVKGKRKAIEVDNDETDN